MRLYFHYLGIHVQYLHVNEKKKTKICRDVNYFETFTLTIINQLINQEEECSTPLGELFPLNNEDVSTCMSHYFLSLPQTQREARRILRWGPHISFCWPQRSCFPRGQSCLAS